MTRHEEILTKKSLTQDPERNQLLKSISLYTVTALLPIALVNFLLVYSSFIRDDTRLYRASALRGSSSWNLSDSVSNISESCDLTKGKWIPDSQPPLYTNDTCKYIQGHQNCMRNGRPDNGYLYWRWQPDGCKLPRFNPHLFLEKMRNKKMMFFGDSIARNHMQSLICAVSQVENPENVYRDPINKDVIWLFPTYNFTLTIFWSPYLVKYSERKENDNTLMEIHLDSPEEVWKDPLPEYDAVVLSAGPWFFKSSIYYKNNEIFGCHHCPEELNLTKVSFIDAYTTVLENVFSYMRDHESYRGTTFLRTFSVEHFENGEWWNGGTCNRTRPFEEQDSVELPWMASEMHKIQLEQFSKAAAGDNTGNGCSKMKLLDITYSAFLRPDGHPGVFRSLGTPGKQSDCLHWCLPGPIDMWNELLLHLLAGIK